MIYTALILGLLGSFHCIGMCGPIAFMLPLDRKSKTRRWVQLISYHSGRLATYGSLGLLFGLVGSQLQLFGIQQQLSIAIGLLMILIVLLPKKPMRQLKLGAPLYSMVAKLKSSIGLQLKKKDPTTFFTMGVLNGLLPCGLVYIAVFGSLASSGLWEGALYMVFFGLGTIPMMTTAIYMGNFLTAKVKQKLVRLIPIFVVLIGALFVLRGLGLDIPYVSPSSMVAIQEVGAQYQCH